LRSPLVGRPELPGVSRFPGHADLLAAGDADRGVPAENVAIPVDTKGLMHVAVAKRTRPHGLDTPTTIQGFVSAVVHGFLLSPDIGREI